MRVKLSKVERNIISNFLPEGEKIPKGLPPMFYWTLDEKKDQEIMDQVMAIRKKLKIV